MDNEETTKYSLNRYFQKLSLLFIFITYTLTFWITFYNMTNLVLGLNVDYFYPTLKSGSLMLISVLAFISCLYTSEFFDTVKDVIEITVEETEDRK